MGHWPTSEIYWLDVRNLRCRSGRNPFRLKAPEFATSLRQQKADMMNNDFSKIHLTNALASTSGHQRTSRRPLMIAVLLLVALGVAVYLL